MGLSFVLFPSFATAADACDGLDNDGDGFFDESTVVVAAGNCGVAIPDHNPAGNGSPVGCTINVTETRPVLDANVHLTISHTSDADLEVDLVTPGGDQLRMFADVGGAGANFTSTVLDDDAGTLIAAGAAPFTGSFQPEDSLDTCIDGTDPSGNWTLTAWDDASGDTGTIGDFSMSFEVANDLDGDGWGEGCECDDSDVTTFPGATEIPDDGIDQDCNGSDTVTCFVDGDLDGDGSAIAILAGDGDCSDPGESWSNTDCNDSNDTVYLGATELCDGLDNDCNGLADFPGMSTGDDDDSAGDDDDSAGPGFESTELDIDGDGYFECDGDCDDDDPTTWTGAPELCDGVDNDCDGDIADEELDVDSDGFSPCAGDCHDTNPAASPGNAEDTAQLCADGFDNDCDGLVDLNDDDCDDFVGDDDDATGGDDDDDDDNGSTGLGCSCSALSDPGRLSSSTPKTVG